MAQTVYQTTTAIVEGRKQRERVFLRPCGACEVLGLVTQGSASLHPWAIILPPLRGSRSLDDRGCVRFSPRARALTGAALFGSDLRRWSLGVPDPVPM